MALQYLLSKPSQKDLEEQGYDSSKPAIKSTQLRPPRLYTVCVILEFQSVYRTYRAVVHDASIACTRKRMV